MSDRTIQLRIDNGLGDHQKRQPYQEANIDAKVMEERNLNLRTQSAALQGR